MESLSNDNPTAKIGPLLKKYRAHVRLTQTYVAQQSGISSSMLSQIESSIVSPSVSTLFAICNAMGMDMAYLMKLITETNPVRVYHANERPKEDYGNSAFEALISKQETPQGGYMFLLEINPGEEIALTGQGYEMTAMGYVISGAVTLFLNEKENYQLKKGDSVLFQSLCPHKFINSSKTLFSSVWSMTPLRRSFPVK